MVSPQPGPTTAARTPQASGDGSDELAALIAAEGFWRLVPDWVPRTGYAAPTPALLRAVEAGLKKRSQERRSQG